MSTISQLQLVAAGDPTYGSVVNNLRQSIASTASAAHRAITSVELTETRSEPDDDGLIWVMLHITAHLSPEPVNLTAELWAANLRAAAEGKLGPTCWADGCDEPAEYEVPVPTDPAQFLSPLSVAGITPPRRLRVCRGHYDPRLGPTTSD